MYVCKYICMHFGFGGKPGNNLGHSWFSVQGQFLVVLGGWYVVSSIKLMAVFSPCNTSPSYPQLYVYSLIFHCELSSLF